MTNQFPTTGGIINTGTYANPQQGLSGTTYSDVNILRQRKEQAGTQAMNAINQLNAMAGQMGTAPRDIASAVALQREPALRGLVEQQNQARTAYYPEVFRTLSNIGTGAADVSPEAAMANAIANYNRAGSTYNLANQLIGNYQADTRDLANQAFQGLQAQYGALGNVANLNQSVEQNLADRIFRGEQLNEQQRQFDIQNALAQAAARSGGGGGVYNPYQSLIDQMNKGNEQNLLWDSAKRGIVLTPEMIKAGKLTPEEVKQYNNILRARENVNELSGYAKPLSDAAQIGWLQRGYNELWNRWQQPSGDGKTQRGVRALYDMWTQPGTVPVE